MFPLIDFPDPITPWFSFNRVKVSIHLVNRTFQINSKKKEKSEHVLKKKKTSDIHPLHITENSEG